jgi:hypothetical protein
LACDILLARSRRDFESEPTRFRLWRPKRHGACLLPWSLKIYFCERILRVIMLVFLLVSAAIEDESCFRFKWLWPYAVTGQGHHLKTQQLISLDQIMRTSHSAIRWDPDRGPTETLSRQQRLGEPQAAINSNHLTRHPIRSRAGKPHDPFCDIVRNSAPTERYTRALLLLDCRSLFQG